MFFGFWLREGRLTLTLGNRSPLTFFILTFCSFTTTPSAFRYKTLEVKCCSEKFSVKFEFSIVTFQTHVTENLVFANFESFCSHQRSNDDLSICGGVSFHCQFLNIFDVPI